MITSPPCARSSFTPSLENRAEPGQKTSLLSAGDPAYREKLTGDGPGAVVGFACSKLKARDDERFILQLSPPLLRDLALLLVKAGLPNDLCCEKHDRSNFELALTGSCDFINDD